MNTVRRASINQDDPCYSAGYDTYSQVHVTPHWHLLQNVVKAEKPIFLNQIHDDYKCVEYGRHPHLNEVVTSAAFSSVNKLMTSTSTDKEETKETDHNCSTVGKRV